MGWAEISEQPMFMDTLSVDADAVSGAKTLPSYGSAVTDSPAQH